VTLTRPESDPRGALRFVTPDRVLQALGAVRDGRVIGLSLPLDRAVRPDSDRPAFERTVRLHNSVRPLSGGRYAVINDDSVAFALQGSSQWDGLAHFGVLEPGSEDVFYGGRGIREVGRSGKAKTLGIETAAAGIVTRAVVLDMVGFLGHAEQGYVPGDRIRVRNVEDCLAAASLELRSGDAVLVFTGALHHLAANGGTWPAHLSGLDADTLPFWRDAQICAIASDGPVVDAVPLDYSMHAVALREDGILLGELWQLDELVAACRADGRYECLLASAPLNIPGAFGSPCNAVAVR
jgi:kynurenine formamidase